MSNVTGGPGIRVQLLGSPALATSDGAEVRALLAQPKRLGLLVYLLLAEPAGLQRRDSLLALFWPELEADASRRALRQSLHFLRTHLGHDAIHGVGSEAVALAPEAFRCDALAFREALRAGRLAEAMEHYRGELLPGFHLRDAAPEFEEWLADQRRRLRHQALEALRQLVRVEEEAGRYARAVVWARAWLHDAPHDDAAVRAVMRLEHATDDPRGALDTYDAFTLRKRHAVGAEPERETRALAETIRREATEPAVAPRGPVPPAASRPDAEPPALPAGASGAPAPVPRLAPLVTQVPHGPWGFVAGLALFALGAALAFAFAMVVLSRR